MGYEIDVEKIGLSILDKAVLTITPDGIIAKTEELVTTVFDEDMTGEQKFNWVLGKIKPFMTWFIRQVANALVQIVYEIVKSRRV